MGTVCYVGDDGQVRKGVAWPSPRFTDNSDGTVTDHVTGLVWLKNANCFGTQTWAASLASANTLASGACSLTDNSVAGDWRLPNKVELKSLIDISQTSYPPLPTSHPFSGVVNSLYWTSTTYAKSTSYAWDVGFISGYVTHGLKTGTYGVWPVRGGP
ncbi:MAG: DUF1566 domain-containing protein [Magnetococcales bacterium]|nr:DUF1566 domain-containing protein [Magnetococcales bacterium]